VLLPRQTNPAFYDGVIAACRVVGLAPNVYELTEPQIEHALFSVAGGAGIALLPASAAERFRTPGVRFLPLDQPAPVTEIALVSRTQSKDEAMVAAFLRLAREPERSSRALPAPIKLAA
jgi:DNA-binding transcriptional LysR family regulator